MDVIYYLLVIYHRNRSGSFATCVFYNSFVFGHVNFNHLVNIVDIIMNLKTLNISNINRAVNGILR